MRQFLHKLTILVLTFIAIPVFAQSVIFPQQGGTGTGTRPVYGDVLVGNASGTYSVQATSTLGISSGGFLDWLLTSDWYATTSVPQFTTLSGLTSFGTTGIDTTAQGNLIVLGTCTGCGGGGVFDWDASVLGNATSTLLLFNQGFISTASSTVSGPFHVSDTLSASSTFIVDGALSGNGLFTLGDNGDTGAINTSDWDITATGVMTGVGTIGMNGNMTMDASAGPRGIILDTTTSDTSFWLADITDNGVDDDDFFKIGKGTTIGTTPYLTINSNGDLAIAGNATTSLVHSVNVLTVESTSASSTFAGDVEIGGNLKVGKSFFAPATIVSSGDVSVGGALTVTGLTTVGDITINGTCTGCGGGGTAFAWTPVPALQANSTSTLLLFDQGFISSASSSLIGNFFITGNSTTTGVGAADTFFASGLGTSTFTNGIDLLNGCISNNGTCLSLGGVAIAETPSGAVNSVNVTYTLSSIPLSNTLILIIDGITQRIGTDYTISGTTITMTDPPQTGSNIFAFAQLPAGGSSQWATSGSDIYYSTGKVGVASTSPWGLLSVHSVSANIVDPLFVVGSTTPDGTNSTLFKIDTFGNVVLGTDTAGVLSVGTTTIELAGRPGESATGTIITSAQIAPMGFPIPFGNMFLATTSGTANFTIPEGVYRIYIELYGGGGAGAGGFSAAINGAAGGAGGAVYDFSYVTPGQLFSYTVGGGGWGTSNAAGTAGTSTIATTSSAVLWANGGNGGHGFGNGEGGAGGIGTGGETSLTIQGGYGHSMEDGVGRGTIGGSNPKGFGGGQSSGGTGSGMAGTGCGGGGGGGGFQTSTGGVGATGCVIIWY